MTLLKTRITVACPKKGQDVNINTADGCRYCEFFGPVSYIGKTEVYLVCHYGEPTAGKGELNRHPDATVQDPAGPQAKLTTN